MKRLEAEWQSYRAVAVPFDAEKVQLQETKKAFFAGAWAFFNLQLKVYEKDKQEPTEADMQVLRELQDEMVTFMKGIGVTQTT